MSPILPAEPGAMTGSWSARATSVAEIEAALAQMWHAAADQAQTDGLTPEAAADARGDPRVAPLLDRPGEIRVRTRTRVLTLVVAATRPELVERAVATVSQLAGRHPSRAIILAPGDPDGPTALDARLSLACAVRPDSLTETCAERILLLTGGELSQHLAGIVAPLLIHDLPVVCWWVDDPPIGTRQFRELTEDCDQVLVDSAAFLDDGAARIAGVAAMVSAGTPAVRDTGWIRLTIWRELLAGLFDHPLLVSELANARSLRLDVLRPGATFRLSRMALFAGWLAAALGWEVTQPLGPRRGTETLHATWRAGRHEVRLEVRPVSSQGPVGMRAAGQLQRVEFELGRGRHSMRARVTRQSDHLLATADWDGAEVARRAARLEQFDEAPYVAEALDQLGHDRVFEDAVRQAERLLSVARTAQEAMADE